MSTVSITSKYETGERSERGIPEIKFIENIGGFLTGDDTTDDAINKLQEYYQKYKLMEMNLVAQRSSLKRKIPEIEKSLEAIAVLAKGESFETQYEVADHIYAKAEVQNTGSVCLWLGANVMLEYTLEEAEELLRRNLTQANENLEKNQVDLDFTKDQITTCQVNMSRLYNHEVKQRRKDQQGKKGGK